MKDKIEITQKQFTMAMAEATSKFMEEIKTEADFETGAMVIMLCGILQAESAKILFKDDEDASKSLAD
ncbi:MAG: hypothetical protein MJY71_08050 [Bacteroidaceae bacterium]|nr:hypothetical protein [Bacteroidaceae bacterium]